MEAKVKTVKLSEMLAQLPDAAPKGARELFLQKYSEAYAAEVFEAVYLRSPLPQVKGQVDELVALTPDGERWLKRTLAIVSDPSPHAELAATPQELLDNADLFEQLAQLRRAAQGPTKKVSPKKEVTPKAQAQPKAKAAVPKTGAALARAAAGESDEATDDQSQQVQSPEGQGHEAQGQQGQGHAQANPNGQGDEAQSKAEGSPSDEGHSDEAPNEQANGAGAAAPPSSPPTPPTVRQPPVPNT